MKPYPARVIPLLVVLLLAVAPLQPTDAQAQPPSVHFLNVGQGDAILLRDGAGFDVLVDGGPLGSFDLLLDQLEELGVTQLDALVATHADADHLSGLTALLRSNLMPVEMVYFSQYSPDMYQWDAFLEASFQRGRVAQQLRHPASLQWGRLQVAVLNPPANPTGLSDNNASIVLRVDAGTLSLLLTGDLEASQEDDLAGRGVSLDVDVLKVAHHGSAGASTSAFLAAVTPRDAVISVGPNGYGHPSSDALSRLRAAGARVWRTDQAGQAIDVAAEGDSFYTIEGRVTPRNGPIPPPVLLPLALRGFPQQAAGLVVINEVYYDPPGSVESGEYVQFNNRSSQGVQLLGWQLSDAGGHVFTFPAFVMSPGQTCRVYTNEVYAEWCGFSYRSSQPIWNNSGDTAELRSAAGELVDRYSYP